MGDHLDQLLDLCGADRMAHKEPQPLTQLRAQIEAVRTESPKETLESPLTGEEIMALLSLPPGREVGVWKQQLVDAVLDGVVRDADSARTWLLEQRQ
jgi:hypothetical protein